MDECHGEIRCLPCCANWIRVHYGNMADASSFDELWNSEQAQHIRALLAEGRQEEICSPHCPWLFSGRFGEDQCRVLPGPARYEENQRLNNCEIEQRARTLRSRPMLLHFIPTLHCNLRCRMCHQDRARDLAVPDWCLPGIRALGPYLYEYRMHGGEVLQDARFPQWADLEWLEEAPQLLLSIITNGSAITEEAWSILEAARLNYVTVSINAASRDMYRFLAGKDLFDAVLTNVRRLRALSDNHRRGPFGLYMSFVITRSNHLEVPAFVALADSIGLPARFLVVTGNRNNESFFQEAEVLENVLKSVNNGLSLARGSTWQELELVRQSLTSPEAQAWLFEPDWKHGEQP